MEFSVLNPKYVDAIRVFLGECIEKNINEKKYNRTLRDDVMAILEEHSTVVYYPLEGESNYGFLIKGFTLAVAAEPQNFVFINTAKNTENQAFAAAHELGHIWGLTEYFSEKNIELDRANEERAMNRFAAMLMMPKDHFNRKFDELLDKCFKDKDKGNTRIDIPVFMSIVAHLMNEYFVPAESVIWRMCELDRLPKETAEVLVEEMDKKEDSYLNKLIQKSVLDAGFTKLLKPSRKKWINELPELLSICEKKGTLTHSKIKALREQFDISEDMLPDEEYVKKWKNGVQMNERGSERKSCN